MERSFAVKATWLYLALLALALLSLSRLYYIQSAAGEEFQQRLTKMWKRTAYQQARRGRILARDGQTVLADNVRLARVIVERHLVAQPEEVAAKLSPYAGLSPEALHQRLTDPASPRSIELMHDVPVETAEQITQLRLPGVFIRYYYQRFYPYAANFAAQTIGYACDKSGLQIGLEAQFSETLAGLDSRSSYFTDRQGHVLPQTLLGREPEHGADIVTSLDPPVQQICEDVLDRTCTRYHAKWGLIAVMDPQTGEILAAASRPTFDPNDYARRGSKGNEANPLVHFAYEPGSVMKPLVAAVALDRGWLSREEKFSCTATMRVGKYTITEAEHDRNPAGYGDIPVSNIIVHSSNVGMGQVGLKLRQAKLSDIFSTLGLYERCGIELPAEAKGLRPHSHAPQGERWPDSVIATCAFGQGIAVTPLQLMRAYAAIANGGRLVRPTILRQEANAPPASAGAPEPQLQLMEGETVVGGDEPGPATVQELSTGELQVMSRATADYMCSLLQRVVREGTGKNAQLDNFNVAGKTGTGQVAGKSGYIAGKYTATFIGFYPASQPRFLILVVIAEPRGAYYASTVAAPAFKEVGERIAIVKEVPPERRHETG